MTWMKGIQPYPSYSHLLDNHKYVENLEGICLAKFQQQLSAASIASCA